MANYQPPLRTRASHLRAGVYRAYLTAANHLRSRRWLHRLLFGYWPAAGSDRHGPFWDWTTLAIRGALRKHLTADGSLLDLGTGHVAALALYAALRLGCTRVTGAEIMPEVADSAALNVARLGAPVEVIVSDMFDAISGVYDVCAFNVPYVADESWLAGCVLRNHDARCRFGGGADGLAIARRFLGESPSYLAAEGRLILGVNHFHVSRQEVRRTISHAGFEVVDVCQNLMRGAAYILKRPNR